MFEVGLITGPSGSGKSVVSHYFVEHGRAEPVVPWSADDPLFHASHWGGDTDDDEDDRRSRLRAMGVPESCWSRPFQTLSSSEGARADLARKPTLPISENMRTPAQPQSTTPSFALVALKSSKISRSLDGGDALRRRALRWASTG